VFAGFASPGRPAEAATRAALERILLLDAYPWCSEAVFGCDLAGYLRRLSAPAQVVIGAKDGVRPYTERALDVFDARPPYHVGPDVLAMAELAPFFAERIIAFEAGLPS
jgi:hypothetical protein